MSEAPVAFAPEPPIKRLYRMFPSGANDLLARLRIPAIGTRSNGHITTDSRAGDCALTLAPRTRTRFGARGRISVNLAPSTVPYHLVGSGRSMAVQTHNYYSRQRGTA